MKTIRKTVGIDASVDRVFTYMTDPAHLPEIWPSMVEVSNVKTQPDGAHSFDWVYKMAGIKFKGHADTTEVEKEKLVVVKNETGIPSTFRWSYEGDANHTDLTVEIEYALPVPVLGRLAEPIVGKINEHEAEVLLENLKTRMEIAEEVAGTME
jgi:uncharacterized membrane protein